MLTDPNHVSEGPVLFTLTSGKKLMGGPRFNDPATEVFWLELDEGYFEPLPYVKRRSGGKASYCSRRISRIAQPAGLCFAQARAWEVESTWSS